MDQSGRHPGVLHQHTDQGTQRPHYRTHVLTRCYHHQLLSSSLYTHFITVNCKCCTYIALVFRANSVYSSHHHRGMHASTHCDVEVCNSVSIQYIALQILENVVKTRWKTLPRAQCEGIRGYIVGLNIKLSSDPTVLEVWWCGVWVDSCRATACTSLFSPSLCSPIYVCAYVCTYVEFTWSSMFCCTESQVLHGQVESDLGPGEHMPYKFAWPVDGS